MTLYRYEYCYCPWCEEESGCRIDHLYEDQLPKTVGPWYCKECGMGFRATVTAPGEVAITKDEQNRSAFTRSMVLLKLDAKDGPIFFVMDHRRYKALGTIEDAEKIQDSLRYFFESHSCPTNWIDECAVVIQDGDPDPHGFLEFVRSVDVPQDFDPHDDNVRPNAWSTLFPEAFSGQTIDGELTPPMLPSSGK